MPGPTKAQLLAEVEALRKALEASETKAAQLEQKLEVRSSALTEALEQQTAMSEILRIISQSPTDVQPVLDVVAENAARVCGATDAVIHRADGDIVHRVAHFGVLPVSVEPGSRRIDRTSVLGRAVLDRRTVQVTDLLDDAVAAEFPEGADLARRMGHRTVLASPLMREDTVVGAIVMRRDSVNPFSDTQVALLETFANQAVIAIENVRLFTELQTSNRDLTTALDTQTATSEILRVISGSRTDLQPVFDAIVQSAVRLLGGYYGTVTRVVGDQIQLAAYSFSAGIEDARVAAYFPRALHSDSVHAQAIRDRGPVNVADAQIDPALSDLRREVAHARGYRGLVTVPLLRQNEALGTIAVARREAGGFTADEIALLQTFADQAVIAIENARLLSELQEKNESLTQAHAQVTEALEQQTATSEILRVISRSPNDLQPVFDIIARRALVLTDAVYSAVHLIEGETIQVRAWSSNGISNPEQFAASFPMPLSAETVVAGVLRTGTLAKISDMEGLSVPPAGRALARTLGVRSTLAVPMRRDGNPIGAIGVNHREPHDFTPAEVALLQTFADQAVIAIENVRLFTELQTSNRELTTALDTQTATSDILRVISGSRTDVQPVFDAIVQSAVRLLRGYAGALTRVIGNQLELEAVTGPDEAGTTDLRALYPRALEADSEGLTHIRERLTVNVADIHVESQISDDFRSHARRHGYHSLALVPMLRHEEVVGTIAVARREPGGFTDDEIALLKTFADQAVIAIENARLLSELQARTQDLTRSVEQLTALGEVGRAVSSTLDLETVLTTIVSRAVELSNLDGGVVFEYDGAEEVFIHRAATETGASLAEARRTTRVRKGEGVVGRTAITLGPEQVPDITVPGAYESRLRENLISSGIRALLAVPMMSEERLIGTLVVSRNRPGAFPSATIELLRTFATQSALAIQNARLFREIEIKSREVEVASQHKSEFLASMSHELRTPLNAVIGFSDVLLQGMFGEMNEKQTEYLRDILASGQHLLSLINDILDLSKIEAGRMDLDLGEFHLPSAIDDAMLLMRERVSRRGLILERHVDERLGEVHADQRKVKQVLLNLLSNAVKFTLEGGRIDVRAVLVDGAVEIAVTDTGIGIAPEDHEAVFEEFKQVGKAEKKTEGTGLGLALCRKFVELHGGRIWVKSEIGAGSTFAFSLPLSPVTNDTAEAR